MFTVYVIPTILKPFALLIDIELWLALNLDPVFFSYGLHAAHFRSLVTTVIDHSIVLCLSPPVLFFLFALGSNHEEIRKEKGEE